LKKHKEWRKHGKRDLATRKGESKRKVAKLLTNSRQQLRKADKKNEKINAKKTHTCRNDAYENGAKQKKEKEPKQKREEVQGS